METHPNTKTDVAPDAPLRELDYKIFTPLMDALIDEGRAEGFTNLELVPIIEVMWQRVQLHKAVGHEDPGCFHREAC